MLKLVDIDPIPKRKSKVVNKKKEVKPKKPVESKSSLPKPILEIVEETKQKEEQEIKEVVQQLVSKHKSINKEEWDIKIGDEITYFDPTLSYEITGYRPINEVQGLDFNPEWFCEARNEYLRTGHYCQFPQGTKRFTDYWTEQYKRCRDGMTVNGYTITGDNYFFLNFYQLPIVDSSNKASAGRKDGFPRFFVSQYTFFHYYELAKRLHMNCILMKARSIDPVDFYSNIDDKSLKIR